MYTYGWFTLRFDIKQQNSVKQLSFDKKINKFFKQQKKQNIKIWVKIYETWQQKAVINEIFQFFWQCQCNWYISSQLNRKRKELQIMKSRDKRGNIITGPTSIKRITKNKQLCP